MPQDNYLTQFLRMLGANLPPENIPMPTYEQMLEYDRLAKEEQAKLPWWKRAGQQGIEALGGVLEGLVGSEPTPVSQGATLKDYMNVGTQGLTSLAGLPFLKYIPKLPKGKVFHGTQKPFELFDPSQYDTGDVLGWMTHFAENPEYAAQYAGGMKGTSIYMPPPGTTGPPVTAGDLVGYKGRIAPRMIPAHIEAQNVLDLVDPNPDDIAAALAALPEFERKRMIGLFKRNRAAVRETGRPASSIDPRHHSDPRSLENPATTVVAEQLRLTPEQFEQTPFDAIRYNDMYEKSWAVPSRTPIRTAFGNVPLTPERKPIRVIRSDRPYTGSLEVAPDRWKHTPLSLPDTPPPTTYVGQELDKLFDDFAKEGIGEIKPPPEIPDVSSSENFNKIMDENFKKHDIKETFVGQLIENSPNMDLKEAEELAKKYYLSPVEKEALFNYANKGKSIKTKDPDYKYKDFTLEDWESNYGEFKPGDYEMINANDEIEKIGIGDKETFDIFTKEFKLVPIGWSKWNKSKPSGVEVEALDNYKSIKEHFDNVLGGAYDENSIEEMREIIDDAFGMANITKKQYDMFNKKLAELKEK